MDLPGLSHAVMNASLRIAAQGPRPAAQVWERYAEPALWSSWSPQIRKVDVGGANRISAGLEGRVWSYTPVPVHFTVDAVDEAARRWAWTVHLGLPRMGALAIHLEHGVDAGAMRTVTWLRLKGPAPVIFGYAPLAQLALRRLVS